MRTFYERHIQGMGASNLLYGIMIVLVAAAYLLLGPLWGTVSVAVLLGGVGAIVTGGLSENRKTGTLVGVALAGAVMLVYWAVIGILSSL